MNPLYQELHRWSTKPFVWGETDCITCLADWVMRVGGANLDADRGIPGIDPAALIRGTYDSRGSCQRETGFLRDPVKTVDEGLATIRSSAGLLSRVEIPTRGDIAVIVVTDGDGRRGPCGALWLGEAWACKGPTGTTTLSPMMVHEVLAIWSIGYEA